MTITMQEALLRLTNYWIGEGCMTVQPMNSEVGAGTLNPATVLRVLGPEPWRVAYVEPSVRPADARYGANPNRLQTHTQFQVILKPDPSNPQELYLRSLEALGIDLRAHDVRFVEDNWASPALGAWGLGWEVWLNGLEITQFTYFQQAGGLSLDPVSVEITYGMERIMMALQKVDHFKEIMYAPGISYGEAFGQTEYEMSRYYLDDADVETNRRLFEDYSSEAQRMLDAHLPVPAHTYVLKCSHTFNVLDARGAVSTTERARAFARMRSLAREVAKLWASRREELGHPLGLPENPVPTALEAVLPPEVDSPATLLFEIGTEELPSTEVLHTIGSVNTALREGLAQTHLAHGDIQVYGTPRRIIATVADVPPREARAERTVRGPRVTAAFDSAGIATKAAEGFARAQGAELSDLWRIDVGGIQYVAVTKVDDGRRATEVLSAVLSELVSDLRSEENMRWCDPQLSFSRPIRWLVALLGDVVIPVSVSTLIASRTTRVQRTADSPLVAISTADGYLELLEANGVIGDPARRREDILASASKLASSVGGFIDFAGDRALVEEVANLVERPNTLLGKFDPSYLDLPAEILATVMRKHQRYLPVRDEEGNLLPYFIAVANGNCDPDTVRSGNEGVLRARYEDALFFWRADLEATPQDLRANLAKLAFEDRLGSMLDRSRRIHSIAVSLAKLAGVSPRDRDVADKAGQLAKFDLSSQMVIELTSLAGVMAREYAQRAGEPDAVARALFEMELPRHADDAIPQSKPGAVLALADRLDLLAGLFSIAAAPTGSSDPFGLRRAAQGVVSILRGHPDLVSVTIPDAMAIALEHQPVRVRVGVENDSAQFVVRRLEQQLLDAGHPHSHVQAVLPKASAPVLAEQTLNELSELIELPEFSRVVEAMRRVRKILPSGSPASYDLDRLHEPAELRLHESLGKVRGELGQQASSLSMFSASALDLVDSIEGFFNDVMVMADDPVVRSNRLGLLSSVREFSEPVIDWMQLN